MNGKNCRPRTFPSAIVPAALERHERGEPWTQIARDLKVSPGTLQARASEYRRGRIYKTTVPPTEELPPPIRSSEAEIVFETYRPPALCRTCGMIHSSEVPCP